MVSLHLLLALKIEKSSTFKEVAHASPNQITFLLIFTESETEEEDGGPNSIDGRICT